MRLKRLAAVTLSMTMALTMTAWANDADAVAVYQEMEAKSSGMTDTDAYMDFKVDMSSGGDHIGMRLEMNVKANNMATPEQMRMNTYMRMTLTDANLSGGTGGPGEAGSSVDLTGTQITANMYYADGMYYMDMLGQKMKTPMPLNEMMDTVKQSAGTTVDSLEYIQNLKLRTEGEDRILSFTMDATKMNGLLQQVMSSLQSITGNGSVSYRDISCEYIVNPEGYCTKSRMKMTMDMTVEGETITMTLDGDVGYANPGQPVTITAPNLAEYTLAE